MKWFKAELPTAQFGSQYLYLANRLEGAWFAFVPSDVHRPCFRSCEIDDEWRAWLLEAESFEIAWEPNPTPEGRYVDWNVWGKTCWWNHNRTPAPLTVRPWIRRKVKGRWEDDIYAPY